jgi:hypothetical protein
MTASGIARSCTGSAVCAVLSALTLFALSACGKSAAGQGELDWARAALERNDALQVVATDAQTKTFTVRIKSTGELRVVRLDQIVAAPAGADAARPAAAAPSAAAATEPSAAPASTAPSGTSAPAEAQNSSSPAAATASPGEPAKAPESAPAAQAEAPRPAPGPRSEAVTSAAPGHVLASGPGYSIKAADAKAAPTSNRPSAAAPVSDAAVEHRHDPIVCQGADLKHIDNLNVEFDGDAVIAEDGCEIHITNSRIRARGVGVLVRNAHVHIRNSQIEGESGAIDASGGGQVYSASSSFHGLSRGLDDASFHDLGGNVWN